MPKPIAFISLVFFFSLSVHAQRMETSGAGSIGISYTGVPAQSFKDTSGGFGYHAFGININVPLFGNRSKIIEHMQQDGKPHFFQVSGRAGFETFRSTIGFLKEQRNFYTASAGIGALFTAGKKNIIMADASLGIASDGLVINSGDEKFRFAGAFIVNNRHSATTTYQYGLVFTYAYGRPLPLPVLGIRKKISTNWTFSAILPVSLQFTDRLNKQMTVSFLVRPAGNRFQIQNKNDFPTNSSNVYLQLRQFELGANWQYRFAKQFSLGAEAGLLGGGKLKFTEPEDRKTILYSANTKPGARFRISLRYTLPHKKTAQSNLDDELLRLN
ncbi:MAG: DUF6268 family outer membrane beta-barrel protein [Chitinophagaceae bacterium]